MPDIDPTWTQSSVPATPAAPAPAAPPAVTPTNRTPVLGILKTAGVFAASATAVYLVIVGPSLAEKGWYFITNFRTKDQPVQVIDTASETNSLSGAAITSALQELPAPPDVPTDDADTASPKTPQNRAPRAATLASSSLGLEDNLLVIPKLNKRIPVIWNSSSDEATMLANLQKGVAHYGFTSLPNEKDGNVFISGHSSFYWWDKGKYKTVFANINALVPGDQLFIQYDHKVFLYEMTGKKTVSPSDVSIAEPTTTPTLSLMTCVPVGTALNRLVVQSKLVRTYASEVQTSASVVPAVEAAEIPASTPSSTPQPQTSTPSNTESINLVPGR